MLKRLVLPFEARRGSGEVKAMLGEPVDSARFPVCRATVEFGLDGYDGFLGWVQLVGTRASANEEYHFEIDPLEIFGDVDVPFAFYGLAPILFDAPYRSDRSQYLDWIAHSFLCFAPSRPMAREVEAVRGFRWGFVISGGEVATVPLKPLARSDWSAHLSTLEESFRSWSFTDATHW